RLISVSQRYVPKVVFALGLVTIELGHPTHYEDDRGGEGGSSPRTAYGDSESGWTPADGCAGWQLARTIEGGASGEARSLFLRNRRRVSLRGPCRFTGSGMRISTVSNALLYTRIHGRRRKYTYARAPAFRP
ncbi:hypothetical protein X777_03129, partial [Ooceraea biroi]